MIAAVIRLSAALIDRDDRMLNRSAPQSDRLWPQMIVYILIVVGLVGAQHWTATNDGNHWANLTMILFFAMIAALQLLLLVAIFGLWIVSWAIVKIVLLFHKRDCESPT